MSVSIILSREAVGLTVTQDANAPANFLALSQRLREESIVCFTGVIQDSSFLLNVDCRWRDDDRTYWSDRRRWILGIVSAFCAETYESVEVSRARGWIADGEGEIVDSGWKANDVR